MDQIAVVNMKGGVNGVKLTYDECETEYNAARTVECYQRLLNKGDQKMVVFDTLGTPGAYAVIGRMAQDHVVLAQYGYGRTDAADGRVWPWVFNAAGHYWGQIAVKMNYIAEKEGGVDKMKGKTIVHLHIDTAYGREVWHAGDLFVRDRINGTDPQHDENERADDNGNRAQQYQA